MAKKTKTTALAKPGDPLVLADGTVIPDPTVDVEEQERPRVSASDFVPSRRRSVKELPAPTGMMNGIGAILTYTILGLSNREIADVLNITTVEVEQIKHHSGYVETFDTILNEFINANAELLQGRIAAYSHEALNSVASVMRTGKESNKLIASRDLLDRAGVRPQDNVNNRLNSRNELRIVLIDNEKEVRVELDQTVEQDENIIDFVTEGNA